jgi:hypothetical protein
MSQPVIALVNGLAGRLAKQGNRPSSEPVIGGYEVALLYGYLAKSRGREEWQGRMINRLENELDLRAIIAAPALLGGLPGLGWTVEHLSRLLPADDANSEASSEGRRDVCSDIDALILRALERGNWHGPIAMKDGLVGLAAYFLERLPAVTAATGLDLVVYHLDRASRSKGDNHHRWLELLAGRGVSDGVAGLIAVLTEVCAAGAGGEAAHRLLSSTMQAVVAETRTYSSEMSAQLDVDTFGSLGGEAGLAAVCLRVSHRTRRDEWHALALKLLARCLISVSRQLVDDCGGSGWLSIGHILNRIFQADGDRRCLDAARKCIELGLRIAEPEKDNPAFLDSPVWPALVILAALTPVEPAWDRLLLLSGYEWPKAN